MFHLAIVALVLWEKTHSRSYTMTVRFLIVWCNDQTHTGEIRLIPFSKAGGDKRKECGATPEQAKKKQSSANVAKKKILADREKKTGFRPKMLVYTGGQDSYYFLQSTKQEFIF